MKALVKDRICDSMLRLPGCVLANAGVSYISSGNGSSVAAAKLVSLLQKSTETAKSCGGLWAKVHGHDMQIQKYVP